MDSEDPDRSPATHARYELIGGMLVIVAVVGFVVGKRVVRALSPRPTPQQCEQLVDRWLSHASRQRDPAVDDDDVDVAEANVRDQPEYVADLERCERELTAGEVACGLESTYLDAFERCMQ